MSYWADTAADENRADWCTYKVERLMDSNPDLSYEEAKELAMAEYDAGVQA